MNEDVAQSAHTEHGTMGGDAGYGGYPATGADTGSDIIFADYVRCDGCTIDIPENATHEERALAELARLRRTMKFKIDEFVEKLYIADRAEHNERKRLSSHLHYGATGFVHGTVNTGRFTPVTVDNAAQGQKVSLLPGQMAAECRAVLYALPAFCGDLKEYLRAVDALAEEISPYYTRDYQNPVVEACMGQLAAISFRKVEAALHRAMENNHFAAMLRTTMNLRDAIDRPARMDDIVMRPIGETQRNRVRK